MAAILVSLGFTFLIDRMTEVLTPDIYIELTAHAMQPGHHFGNQTAQQRVSEV
jgi:hypothetical protein